MSIIKGPIKANSKGKKVKNNKINKILYVFIKHECVLAVNLLKYIIGHPKGLKGA